MNLPRSVMVKTLVTTKNTKDTFEFFTNVKNWESGGSLKNVQKTSNDFWLCDSPFGKAKIKLRSDEEFGILDHDFFVDIIKWTVFAGLLLTKVALLYLGCLFDLNL
ncbi:MAG: hypothetical protein HC944_06005 [Nanoarchaeota archaeon]|nr:hypothetical protein [Nanoarchaeota archaeon]